MLTGMQEHTNRPASWNTQKHTQRSNGVNVSGSHALKKRTFWAASPIGSQNAGSMLHISRFQYLSRTWPDIRPEIV